MRKMIDSRQIIVEIHKEQGLDPIEVENIHGMPMIFEEDKEKFKKEITELIVFIEKQMNKGCED